MLARFVDDGPVGWHVVLPRNPCPRTLRIECPFTAFLHLLRSLKAGNRSTQVSIDCRVKANNKPHSVMFSTTSDCCQTIDAFEIRDNRLRRKVRDKPVDQLLFGYLEDGWISRQRAGHDEARRGPRRVAVRSISAVCSQLLPQTCSVGLNSGPVTDRDPFFSYSDFQKFDRYVRDLLHFVFVVLTSALHAPNNVFGERSEMSSLNLPYKSMENALRVSGF